MKNLIPEDDYGVFADQKGVARVDSLFVAATFEKGHRHVLRDIARIIEPDLGSVKISSMTILYSVPTEMLEEGNCRVTC